MIIVTTLYNAENYIERCLFSLKIQSFKDFKCYITDDLSTDKSVQLVKNYIKDDNRFILIENKEKLYQPGNYDQVIRYNENIGDNDGAVTRFVLVAKPGKLPAPTGNDRTSLAVFIAIDHAGALLEVLTEFAKQNVNLTFIQSRPTGRELGHYHFIIDAEGHIDDASVSAALAGLQGICEDIRFLGSYPRQGGLA
jgi:prephenate dehydratase